MVWQQGLTIKIVCAWCQKSLGTKRNGSGTSHGICSKCEKKLRKEIETAKKRKGKVELWKPKLMAK